MCCPDSAPGTIIIGQDGRSGSVVGTRLTNTRVVPHGGRYLFVPSMAGLRVLCRSGAEAASA